MIATDGEYRADRASATFLNGLSVVLEGEVPSMVSATVERMMESPPGWGCVRAPRVLLARHLAHCVPDSLRLHPSCLSFAEFPDLRRVLPEARSMLDILRHGNGVGPRRDLQGLQEHTVLEQLRLRVPDGKVLLYGQFQSRRIRAGELSDSDPIFGGGDHLFPTMPSSPNYHPIYYDPVAGKHLFLSLPQVLECFDVPLDSCSGRTAMRLGRKSTRVAHGAVCSGWSGRVSASIFDMLGTWCDSPLRARKHWTVGLLFAGADMATAGLHHCGRSHEVVFVAESRGVLREALMLAHPGAAFESDAGAGPSLLRAAPPCDLALMGFRPCGPFSSLHNATSEEAWDVLRLLERSLVYVSHHLPSVVVLENLPQLQSSRWKWALDEICRMLNAVRDSRGVPAYVWHLGELCPSDFGGSMYRPRVWWIGRLLGGSSTSPLVPPRAFVVSGAGVGRSVAGPPCDGGGDRAGGSAGGSGPSTVGDAATPCDGGGAGFAAPAGGRSGDAPAGEGTGGEGDAGQPSAVPESELTYWWVVIGPPLNRLLSDGRIQGSGIYCRSAPAEPPEFVPLRRLSALVEYTGSGPPGHVAAVELWELYRARWLASQSGADLGAARLLGSGLDYPVGGVAPVDGVGGSGGPSHWWVAWVLEHGNGSASSGVWSRATRDEPVEFVALRAVLAEIQYVGFGSPGRVAAGELWLLFCNRRLAALSVELEGTSVSAVGDVVSEVVLLLAEASAPFPALVGGSLGKPGWYLSLDGRETSGPLGGRNGLHFVCTQADLDAVDGAATEDGASVTFYGVKGFSGALRDYVYYLLAEVSRLPALGVEAAGRVEYLQGELGAHLCADGAHIGEEQWVALFGPRMDVWAPMADVNVDGQFPPLAFVRVSSRFLLMGDGSDVVVRLVDGLRLSEFYRLACVEFGPRLPPARTAGAAVFFVVGGDDEEDDGVSRLWVREDRSCDGCGIWHMAFLRLCWPGFVQGARRVLALGPPPSSSSVSPVLFSPVVAPFGPAAGPSSASGPLVSPWAVSGFNSSVAAPGYLCVLVLGLSVVMQVPMGGRFGPSMLLADLFELLISELLLRGEMAPPGHAARGSCFVDQGTEMAQSPLETS